MKRYFVTGLLLVLVVFFLYGCGGDGNGEGVMIGIDEAGGETINGISVPPAPDPVIDSASIAGVDSNNNGIRDNVERLIAEEFGSDAVFYKRAKAYAIAEQIVIMNPTPEKVSAYLDLLRCEKDNSVIDKLGRVDGFVIDTNDRANAFSRALAGVLIGSKGC